MAQVYGVTARSAIQLGREVTPGTAVAAAHVWRGPFASMSDDQVWKMLDENIGNLYGDGVYFGLMKGASLQLPETPMTFEQLVHIFDAGWMDATPSGPSPYVRNYVDVPGTPQVLRTYTVEAGSFDVPLDALRMEQSFVSEWALSAAAGEEWLMSATFVGRQISVHTMTPSLAPPAVNVAILPLTKLYIDATGGTVGTTQKTGVLVGAQIQRTTGWKFVPVGDGSLYPVAIKQVAPTATFSLTIEVEQNSGVSLVAAERAFRRAGTSRLFRLKIEGPSASHSLELDWCGKYTEVGSYEDNDGNLMVTLSGEMKYNSTDALFMEATLKNLVADLDS